VTPEEFALLGIDPITVLQVLTWGFGFVVVQFFAGWVVGVAISVIRKL
jgi:hypothetical protein